MRPMCRADLMQPDAPARLVAAAFAAEPELDTLVCNAGSFFDLPFLEMTRERWEKTMQLNLTADLLHRAGVCAAARRGEARRLHLHHLPPTASRPEPDSDGLRHRKGALVMLIRSLAVSLAPTASA